ncbi:MAG: EAL domain-containing protein [Burkholderiales bacterium]|nr:EAL domain-containing protein [Burkholderiales bacterium]
MEYLGALLNTDGFLPHGYSYLWTPALLWIYVVSDIGTGLAFYFITWALTYFVHKRTDLKFNWIFKLFSAFIFFSGTTHLLSVWTIWQPAYWIDALVKAATAVVSAITAILLWPLIPKALKLPSTAQLEDVIKQLQHQIAERTSTEGVLAQLNASLEERVKRRTHELLEINERLQNEIETRKNIEHDLYTEKERAQVTLRSIGDAVITVGMHQKICYLNPVAQRMTGWTEAEALGKDLEQVFHLIDENTKERLPNPITRVLEYGQADRLPPDVLLISRDGVQYAIEDSAAPMLDAEGNLLGAVMVFHDISEARKTAKEMAYLANHDVLTGLPNRALLNDRLENALALAHRESRRLALLFIDIDHFKDINDSLGHDVGDQLLVEIGTRFSDVIRNSDTVCRQGGDEFIILMPDIPDNMAPAEVARKLLDALAEMQGVAHHDIRVSGSIGIAVYPDNGRDAETLTRHADMAMYHAKISGRNNFQFYTQTMTESVAQRIRLENGLRRAIEKNEFVVHYQPKISLDGGHIIGAEALVRWQHPSGMVSPGKFIPVAEQSGLIKEIGSWVLREVCRQNREWQMAGLGMIPIAVNLSPAQLHQEGFLNEVIHALRDLDLPNDCLEFEVTESISIHGEEKAITWLRTLKEMGVRLSIDDFGTGYSSLSYLKRLPIDTIKIDQSFVRDITTDPDDAAIIEAIIQMAHSLRLEVIAEGVETVDQLDFLRDRNCDQVQGYYYSEPVPADRFSELLTVH